jgi:hypothetical protein
LLDLLMRHRERLRQLQPEPVETRLMQFLVEERRRTVNEKMRQISDPPRSGGNSIGFAVPAQSVPF